MQNQFSRRQTFSERHGLQPVPPPLNPGELSDQLRLELNDLLQSEFDEGTCRYRVTYEGPDWQKILGSLWVQQFRQSRFQGAEAMCLQACQNLFRHGLFGEVLSLMEELAVKIGDGQPSFQREVNAALTRNRAPYLLHNSPTEGWIIIETGSGKEREAVLQSLADISNPIFSHAREHFEKAGHRLAKGEFPESAGQAAKALEACLRKLTNKPDLSGGKVLEIYADDTSLPPRLKQLMGAVWQYRNEAEDVAHSRKDNATSPPPDRWEAQLLYVVIAGCLSFLVNKWREITSNHLQ